MADCNTRHRSAEIACRKGYPIPMRHSESWSTCLRLQLLLAPFVLAGCASQISSETGLQANTAVLPSSIPPDQLVGRWGVASYHQEDARVRTEHAAKAQCKQP